MFAHAQSPVRIGLAGGGTDLPAWTRERPGRCLTLSVAAYTHAVAIVRPDGQVVASYRHLDIASAATEIANGLVRESALLHGFEDGFETHTMSELTSQGSGLGVSSSIAVSLAACFSRLARLRKGDPRDPAYCDGGVPGFRADVARDAWTVEIDRLRRLIGRQDHMAAAYGGLKLYRFEGSDASVGQIFDDGLAAWAAEHLLLVRLPEGHDSRAILSGVKRADQMQAAADSVDAAVEAVMARDARGLGRAISMGQRSKASIPGAVPSGVAELVRRIEAVPGVHGCKVAGAGGGGHLVACLDPDAAEGVALATDGLPQTRVKADLQGVRSDGWL